MVYRGKPSAGCENCRKAKKRCGLERPACLRCVKVGKVCSGYRDTTALQIQDESAAVKLKVDRRKAQSLAPQVVVDEATPRDGSYLQINAATFAAITPLSNTPTPAPSEGTIDLTPYDDYSEWVVVNDAEFWNEQDDGSYPCVRSVPMSLSHSAAELATTYFYNRFASAPGHWMFLNQLAAQDQVGPLVNLAVRACGMATFHNAQSAIYAQDYARAFYGEALTRLNAALRDPKKCKEDESLVAVSMLSYYENLTCDSRQSIASWKAHIHGGLQILKLRGRQQFKSAIGRMLFREIRSQALICYTWDDAEPPAFLKDYNAELATYIAQDFARPGGDELADLVFDFAMLRSKVRYNNISDTQAIAQSAQMEMQFIEWATVIPKKHSEWRYTDVELPDSPHFWNGLLHGYEGYGVVVTWNTYRAIRIMLSRTQQTLCSRFELEPSERAAQVAYFRSVRRQMTDEICYSIPSALGHAPDPYNSPCVMITAYASIWPLFFAGTCCLERIDKVAGESIRCSESPGFEQMTSAPLAQVSWIVGRLQYISDVVGLKWADGIVAILEGELGSYSKIFRDHHVSEWAQSVSSSGRGPKMLIEKATPISQPLEAQPRSKRGPMWLGQDGTW